ncbi:uncharacterized protein LOC118437712 [Folsomia candida]|uniref:uncharacterized protein LOC118437712 n=1 Tax=Folsomia candida TaxID=158441 RepID=UPI001604A827|nr:uncharacterized protein LOC118437712 [Folsomia candida]
MRGEKALAAENEEANQFTELARTHSGRIVVAKRQRSYPGAKQLCMDFGMRVIAWNELKFKNGNVEELYLKYRRTQPNIYTLYFWVDVGDNAPTKAPKNGAKSRRRRSPEDEEWDKKCWGMQYLQPEVWEGWLPNLHERWCHQPHPVICIDDNVLA